jgi:hypothetical protein
MRAPSYTSLDEALETLAPYEIALRNGNSNHAPMVAEALCAMGRPEAVMPWIADYRDRMLPRPPASGRIRRDDWRSALGRRDRFAEWSAFFGEELAEAPWRQVLDRWVSRLAPGTCGAATHGVIRLGHAVRSLADSETPWRLRELADALASWAAVYRTLPTAGHITNSKMAPRAAIAKVAILPPAQRRQTGNITALLAALDDFPEFAPVIGLLDTGGDVAALLSQLTEVFTRVYLANAHTPLTTIAFVHGVTSVAAIGNIAPHTGAATARTATRYAWQSGCGLYACFGGGTAMAETVAPCEKDEGALTDLAVAHGDEHVIKFTEACLRRYALAPSPAYLAAIEHVRGMLGPPRARVGKG